MSNSKPKTKLRNKNEKVSILYSHFIVGKNKICNFDPQVTYNKGDIIKYKNGYVEIK